MVFDDAYWVTPLLDRLVQYRSAYGMPKVPSGLRVVGHRPMHLLCEILDLVRPQGLLAGESSIPTREALLAELANQRAMPLERLEAQAEIGFRTYDSGEMRSTVDQLFGPQPRARFGTPRQDGSSGHAGKRHGITYH